MTAESVVDFSARKYIRIYLPLCSCGDTFKVAGARRKLVFLTQTV